ncbi:MAG: DM13 domain-containing protein, partial [Chloroflexota bacterium]
ATMEVVMQETSVVMEEEMPAEEPSPMQILAQGEFYDVAHHGQGTVTLYQLQDGSQVLRFENFEVLNGPELHVYLTSADPVEDTVGSLLPGGIDLGKLKGNIGDQNYELSAPLDLSKYKSVVIWCEPFRVSFSAALLVAP